MIAALSSWLNDQTIGGTLIVLSLPLLAHHMWNDRGNGK